MTALHRGGAGNSPCTTAGSGGRRAVCRAGAMMTALVAAASLSVTGYACVLAVHRQHVRAADSRRVVSGISALVNSRALVALSAAAKAGSATKATSPARTTGTASTTSPARTTRTSAANGPLALTASERRDCSSVAAACVDLTDKITWLQAGGKVTYGPVRIEPSPAGTPLATPAGTFHVISKAGPDYRSTAFHDLIGWAVFFAPAGIAFCPGSLTHASAGSLTQASAGSLTQASAGSLTEASAGCVHLTLAAARFYDQHLPAGAEVVVFLG